MKRILLLSAMMLCAVMASAKDIRTLVVTTTPQMHCAKCENKIKGNLRFEKGIKRIETNIPAQTVTIEYDADKTKAENLVKAFGKFGYQARPVKAGEPAQKQKDVQCQEKDQCDKK
ncbi:MAG: heavy-metal-associated domain-containing protein [Bacteroidales bacterium]|nr:heavy-metal-associated domain-containing protein [Bacteroidales bacterium]